MAEDFHKQTTLPGVAKRNLLPETPPKNIAGFRIESLLEKGGMSLVYLATREETSELVILKILSPEFLDNDEVIARFLKESNIIAMADHPNIVKLFSQGKWEGWLYIVMEYIPGISLHELLKTTQPSLKRALEITLEAAYALCHLHSFGIIHRDLKLENILLTKAGEVKVIDFGIAQVITEKSSSGTNRKRIIGTPVYMSPEQRADPESVTYSSDIYSLGIILYELIIGRLCRGKIHLSLTPKSLQPILTKCLAPNPLERYQDVVDLIADLSNYMNEENAKDNRQPAELLEEVFSELGDARASLLDYDSSSFQIEIHSTSISSGFVVKGNSKCILVAGSAKEGVKGVIENLRIKSLVDSLDFTLPVDVLFKSVTSTLKTQKIQAHFSLLQLNQDLIHFESNGVYSLVTVRGDDVTTYSEKVKLEQSAIDTLLLSTVEPAIFKDQGLDLEQEVLKFSQDQIASTLTKKFLTQKRLPSFLFASLT